MENLSVTLTDDLHRFVGEQAAQGGYASPGDYVQSLLQKTKQQKAAQAHLETLLLAGLDSGPMEEMPDDEWDTLRREVRERHAARRGRA